VQAVEDHPQGTTETPLRPRGRAAHRDGNLPHVEVLEMVKDERDPVRGAETVEDPIERRRRCVLRFGELSRRTRPCGAGLPRRKQAPDLPSPQLGQENTCGRPQDHLPEVRARTKAAAAIEHAQQHDLADVLDVRPGAHRPSGDANDARREALPERARDRGIPRPQRRHQRCIPVARVAGRRHRSTIMTLDRRPSDHQTKFMPACPKFTICV
jgi:hypothetical protein